MRKITQKSINAFLYGRELSEANMHISHFDGNSYMRLHNNLIAKIENGELYITNCGYFTNTTKERLNALPNVRIQQKAFKWYLNGKEWDGTWKIIEGYKRHQN